MQLDGGGLLSGGLITGIYICSFYFIYFFFFLLAETDWPITRGRGIKTESYGPKDDFFGMVRLINRKS